MLHFHSVTQFLEYYYFILLVKSSHHFDYSRSTFYHYYVYLKWEHHKNVLCYIIRFNDYDTQKHSHLHKTNLLHYRHIVVSSRVIKVVETTGISETKQICIQQQHVSVCWLQLYLYWCFSLYFCRKVTEVIHGKPGCLPTPNIGNVTLHYFSVRFVLVVMMVFKNISAVKCCFYTIFVIKIMIHLSLSLSSYMNKKLQSVFRIFLW